MNSYSHAVCELVTHLNKQSESPYIAYSVDAGFHVFLFTMKENVEKVKQQVEEHDGKTFEL